MNLLIPVDGSDCSDRALDFGIDLATQYDATVEVVHFTEKPNEDEVELGDRILARLDDAGLDASFEMITDVNLDNIRSSDHVGKHVLDLLDDGHYDHIVMGHHGTGRLGRALLGSAAETVVKDADVPVTVIPCEEG